MRKPLQTNEQKLMIAELRKLYGGMMSLADICVEIGRTRDAAKRWIANVHLPHIDINGRPGFRTSDVAIALEAARVLR